MQRIIVEINNNLFFVNAVDYKNIQYLECHLRCTKILRIRKQFIEIARSIRYAPNAFSATSS